MGDADHVAYEDALAEWDAVEQLGLFRITYFIKNHKIYVQKSKT